MRNGLELWRATSPWSLLEDVDTVFNRFIQTPSEQKRGFNFNPACDIEEKADHFLLSMDIPGIPKEDVKIEVVENTLTISGERKNQRFERSFTLPQKVDISKIEARYENGVLELAVPKAEDAKPLTIQIQSGKEGLLGKFLGREAN